MPSSEFTLGLATEAVIRATLEEMVRAGALRALQQAIDSEVARYIDAHRQLLEKKTKQVKFFNFDRNRG